jgi:hypothetical protein
MLKSSFKRLWIESGAVIFSACQFIGCVVAIEPSVWQYWQPNVWNESLYQFPSLIDPKAGIEFEYIREISPEYCGHPPLITSSGFGDGTDTKVMMNRFPPAMGEAKTSMTASSAISTRSTSLSITTDEALQPMHDVTLSPYFN